MNWDLLSSGEFETLALEYARFKYKEYSWEPTDKTRDDNHDFYYTEADELQQEWQGWGEAKHSGNEKSIMSRQKWDQTIVSGKLANNVRHIMFVTNAQIPKRYIFRAECLKTPPFEKFEYVNNIILEDWLFNNPQFIPTKLKSSFSYNPSTLQKKMKVDFFIVDYFSSSRNILNSKTEVYANKDYLLFVIVESNYNTNISIEFKPNNILKVTPYEKMDVTEHTISKGLQCFKFIVNFHSSGKYTLKIYVKDILYKKNTQKSVKLDIMNDFEPQISYQKQFDLLETLLDVLSTRESENRIYTLYAPKGTGKTYLLRMLLKEHKLFNKLMFLTFDISEAECARNICDLFLAINFGIDYSDAKYWQEILLLYGKLPEEERTLSTQDLHEIYIGSKKDKTEESILGFEKIESFIEKNGFKLYKNGMREYITFVMDDVHKIPERIGNVLTAFIKEYSTSSSNGKILFTAREYEFRSILLKETITTLSNKPYKLDSPTLPEKCKSLQMNFPFIENTDYFSAILSKCHSTMHLCILLRRIHSWVESNGKSEAKLQIQLGSMLNELKKGNISIEYQDFLFYRKDFDLLFLVYAYGSGVNINFFKNLDEKIYKKIQYLIRAGVLEEHANYVFPKHDTYLEVFDNISKGTEFTNEKRQAACLLGQNLNSIYIDKFKALPVLLLLDENYDDVYMIESMKMLNEYYQMTEFGKMNLLCEMIVKKKYPYPESNDWSAEKLWIFYLYGECLDHCGSLQYSKECFEMVYDNGLSQITDNSLDFIFDAKAQIFNIKYALLDTVDLLKDIDLFLKKHFHKIKYNHSDFFEKAFLNAINRRMMITLLLDEYNEAENVASAYKDLALELDNKSHQAFYYIDYARGNYHRIPSEALEYMKIAYKEFQKLPNEKRRLIDSKSEMLFLECVINKAEPYELDKTSESILQNGYIHMYAHTLLKRAAIRISRGELDIAQNLLNKLSLIIDLEQFSRLKLLFCNLMSAIYFLKKDIKMMEEYRSVQNKLSVTIGKSYKNERKTDLLTRVDFNCCPGDDYFPIETRLW